MRSARCAVAITTVTLVGLAGCSGGDDDAAPPSEDPISTPAPGALGTGDVTDGSEADVTAPTIDPATMPDAGTIALAVDGRRFEFRSDDPGALGFECSIDAERIGLDFQNRSNSHVIDFTAAILDGMWSGLGASNPEEVELRYSTNLDPSSVVLVDPPYVMVVSAFRSRPDDDPSASDDAGRGTITANCTDTDDADDHGALGQPDEASTDASTDDEATTEPGAPPTTDATSDATDDTTTDDTTTDGSTDAGAPGDSTAGTADADGRVAVVEIGTTRFDLGARPDVTLRCGFVDGVGGFLFGETTIDATFGIDVLISTAAEADDPHILVIDEENDVVRQAGPIPSSAYAEAGAGGIDEFRVDGERVTGTATFIDPRDDGAPTQSGRFEFVCP